MANSPQARKRARQSETRRQRNVTLRTRARTFLKRAHSAIEAGKKDEAGDHVKTAISEIDAMIPKGIFNKNTAARLKSRLVKRLKKLTHPESAASN